MGTVILEVRLTMVEDYDMALAAGMMIHNRVCMVRFHDITEYSIGPQNVTYIIHCYGIDIDDALFLPKELTRHEGSFDVLRQIPIEEYPYFIRMREE